MSEGTLSAGAASLAVHPDTTGFGGRLASGVEHEVGGVRGHLGHVGGIMKDALLGGFGVVAVGIGAILKTGFDEAKDAAAGQAQLASGIASTGNAANVTVPHLKELASRIQDYSGQTDDSIVKSEQLLLTFTNIQNKLGAGNDIFDQATAATANLAAKMGGDASGAAIQLGKALNDPTKGITALTRVGVSFDDAQKKQIASMQASGNVMGAQKIILAELNKEFGGAAKAAGESLPGQLARGKRAFEDLSQSVVETLLPVVTPLITNLAEGFRKAAPEIQKVASLVVDGIGAAFRIVGPIVVEVKDWLVGLFEGISSGGGAVDGSKSKLAEWGAIAYEIFDRVRTFVVEQFIPAAQSIWVTLSAALEQVQAAIARVWPIVQAILAQLVALFESHRAQIKEIFDRVVEIFRTAFTLIGTIVEVFSKVVLALWDYFGKYILQIIRTVFDVVITVIGDALRIVGDIIKIATDLLQGHWSKAWHALLDIISAVWDAIKAVVSGALKLIGDNIAAAWKVITGAASAAWTAIVSAVSTGVGNLLSLIGGLPGKVTTAVAHLWDGIVSGFKAAINFVIRAWDAIPTFHIHVPHILGTSIGGDYDIGLPKIPELAAGGIAKATPGGTLARLGEGRFDEAIVPLDGRTFGNVNLTFNVAGSLDMAAADEIKAHVDAALAARDRDNRAMTRTGAAAAS